MIQSGEAHWEIFALLMPPSPAAWRDLQAMLEERPAGNLVPDAGFAALAIESGCEWITMNHDYARFSGLRWRLPE